MNKNQSILLGARRAGKTAAALAELNRIVDEQQRRIAGLSARCAKQAEQIAELEKLRPQQAQGYTSGGIEVPSAVGALQSLWDLLGATNQTEAVTKLLSLLAENAHLENALALSIELRKMERNIPK